MTDDAAARVAEQIIHSLPATENLRVADYEEVAEYLRAYGDQREREALKRAAKICDEAFKRHKLWPASDCASLILALIPKGPAND